MQGHKANAKAKANGTSLRTVIIMYPLGLGLLGGLLGLEPI